jgi:hypothetical protein
MDSRAGFPTVPADHLRGTAATHIDTGFIPTPVTSTETSGPANRGVETNTARGVKEAPVIVGITSVEYGSAADQPIVEGFKTYGSN